MFNNSHTILVVDPDERSYKTFASVLGVKNSVLFVPNSKTAIDLPDSHPIDLVFVSRELNGTDGMMFLENFKKRFPAIPVVLIAEPPKVDEVIAAFRSGARELLVKPIDKDELVAVTKKILGFISNKKPKHRWFFPVKRKTQTNKFDNNNNPNFKKGFHQSNQTETLSVTERGDFPAEESLSLAEDANNRLIVDVDYEPAQADKGTHPNLPIVTTHPVIEAFFFGPLRVLVNNRPIENWPSKKGKSIFAYLLSHHKKKIFRDVLMDLLWRKSDPDSARNCLNVTIHGLRRVLQDIDPKTEYILFKDECYYFNPEIEIRLDVEKFRKIWRKAQSIEHAENLSVAVSEYERAAAIYMGEFLEEEIYDNWSSFDRENLKEIYLVVLDKISENFMHDGNHRKAIRLCKIILQKDNCREDIYRRLMVCYYRIGQRNKALKLFRKCVKMLQDELEVKPAAATIELYRKIEESQL